MKEDASMRARLRALAESEELPALDDVARMRAERAALAQREQARRRCQTRWLLASVAAASALGWLGWRHASAPVSVRAPQAVLRRAPAVSAPEAPSTRTAQAPDSPCTPDTLWTASSTGGTQLLLTERALLVTAPGTHAAGGLNASCDVEVMLARGSVSVHARRLAGHKLSVRTPLGEVSVKGTIFEVSFDPEQAELVVRVDEGLVAVTEDNGQAADVPAGQVLQRQANTSQSNTLSWSARNRLRAMLGLAPRPVTGAPTTGPAAASSIPSPEPPPTRIWQEGTVPAPRVEPEPGSSLTEDGRPLSKPRLIRKGAEP